MKTVNQKNWDQQKEMIKTLYPNVSDEDLQCGSGKEAQMLSRIAKKVQISEEALHAILHGEDATESGDIPEAPLGQM